VGTWELDSPNFVTCFHGRKRESRAPQPRHIIGLPRYVPRLFPTVQPRYQKPHSHGPDSESNRCDSKGNLWAFVLGSRTAPICALYHHSLFTHTPTANSRFYSLSDLFKHEIFYLLYSPFPRRWDSRCLSECKSKSSMTKVQLSFQLCPLKRDLWLPSRISFCILMTISSLIFSAQTRERAVMRLGSDFTDSNVFKTKQKNLLSFQSYL